MTGKLYGAGQRGIHLVVVVTYRSRDVARGLWPVLRNWLSDNPAGRVVVIENSGSADQVAEVADALPSNMAAAILNSQNSGFAPAVNQAWRYALDEWGVPSSVTLLNPDVVVDSETLAAVIVAGYKSRAGVLSPLLVSPEGKVDKGTARREWNRRRLLAELIGWPFIALVLGTAARNIKLPPANGRFPVSITSGALMFVSADVFGQGLDTRLPMYLEDQDICLRSWRLGRPVVVETSIEATHLGGQSRKQHTQALRQLRILELVEAPAMSLADWKDYRGRRRPSALGIRVLAIFGGVARIVSAQVLAGLSAKRHSRAWRAEQLALGRWFIAWGVKSATLRMVPGGGSAFASDV